MWSLWSTLTGPTRVSPHLEDPCLMVIPPCVSDADRFSLVALRHIHKELDDDNDGGIEVNESVEVSFANTVYICPLRSTPVYGC